MQTNNQRRRLLLGGSLAVLGAPIAALSQTQPIRWRMATSWPTSLPLLHEAALDFAQTTKELSAERLLIDIVDPSKHSAPAGLLQAVMNGRFEMAHTTAQYYAGVVPSIDFFTAVPFGLTAIENQAWLAEGGGQALFEQVLAARNVLPLAVGHTTVQMGGWFAKELRSASDLKGVRIRVAGLPGRVLARLGAVPVNLPLGQIAGAFADGKIDAADVVGPAIDATLPIAAYAPHYYAPWHEPDVVLHLFVDRSKFLALSPDLQAVVRHSAQAAALRSMARALDRNALAMRDLERRGIHIKPLPESLIAALKEATAAELAENARSDPESKLVVDSLLNYKARVASYAAQSDGGVFRVR